MPFVASDWTITRSTGNIRYVGDAHGGASPSYATVIELHRALQDFADDEFSSGDDELSIIDETPSDRGGVDTNISLINGFNIDQTASEHLYDGSITQANGDEIYDGIRNFGNVSSIQIIQNGARLTNDFWNEPAVKAATSDSISSTSHRFMVLVRTGGADIDGRRLLGTQRVYGTQYTEFFIGGGTERGNNVLALNANPDNNNQTASATVAGFTDIVITEGFTGIDVDGDNINESYYTSIDIGSRSKNDLYERSKYIQREGTSETIFGLNGDIFRGITHQWDYDGLSGGNFSHGSAVTWTGGSAQVLADDGTGTMWVQLLTGQAPSNDTPLTQGSVTANVDGAPVSKTLSSTFVGTSTGTAIIGSFGVGIEESDLTSSDILIDLTDCTRAPPNFVFFEIVNLVPGEDYVLVTANDNGDIDFDQLSLLNTLSGTSVTSIQMALTIPTDTPESGSIFVELDSGNYLPVNYSSYSGDIFTVAPTNFSGDNATAGNNSFIAYMNKLASASTESFGTVFSSPRSLFIRIRDGGTSGDLIPTKTFETTATLGNAGGSVGNIRTTDG